MNPLRVLVVLSIAVALGGLLLFASCSSSGGGGTRPPNGGDDEGTDGGGFPITGESFTLDLGGGAVFDLTAGGEAVRNAFAVQLFTETPTDSPSNCTLALDTQDVQMSGAETAQTQSITVAAYIGDANSTNPCDDGENIGSFTVSYDGATVSLGTGELSLSGTALSYVSSGSFTICLSASADADAIMEIVSMTVRFAAPTEPGPEDGEPDQAVVDEIRANREALEGYDSELQALLLTTDEETAKQQMVLKISADPAVEWAESGPQGISIQYQNGLRAAIVLDTEDLNPAVDEGNGELEGKLIFGGGSGGRGGSGFRESDVSTVPASKKTLLLNPHNWERKTYADSLIATANTVFARCGFQNFETYFNEAATVGQFKSLEGYGIIHIYSHGYAWPNRDNPTEIYVMTGHVTDPLTTALFWAEEYTEDEDFLCSWTEFPKKGERNEVYWLSPALIADYNDLTEDGSLVYLGFCHSWRGSWQKEMGIEGAGAAACLGWDWSVWTDKNVALAKSLYNLLGDKTYWSPVSLEFWYDNTDADYEKLDTNGTADVMDDFFRTVTLRRGGSGYLTLWEEEEEEETPCSVYDLGDRWLFKYDYECDGEMDSENLWHLREDGTVSHHWLGVIEGNTWEREGNTIIIWDTVGDTHREGTLSNDCTRIEDGRWYYNADRSLDETSGCWTAEKG